MRNYRKALFFENLQRCYSYNTPYEKVGNTDPVSIADEVPFDIPDSWEWVRLGTVCEVARGGSPRPIKDFLTESENGINWIKIGDTDKGGKYINSTKERIIPEGMKKSRFVHAGDFLLTNSMSFGRPYILNVDGCIHDGWLVLSGYQGVYYRDFLYYMLSSSFAYSQFCDVVSGAVVKNLNSDKVAVSLFPLPPIAEQERIVKIIEALEPYIEEYDKVESKITSLQNSFPDKLKKSILQTAVQGKLVSQDPSDEPASVLLERIRAEKERLIKEGKTKRDKNESVIFRRDNSHYEKLGSEERCIDEEIPFEIPDSWEWVRWGSLSESIQYGYNAPAKDEGRIRMVRISDIQDNTVIWDSVPYCDINEDEVDAYLLKENDILFARTGGTVGKSFLVSDVPYDAIYAGYLIRTRYSHHLCPQYLKFFMESSLYWSQLKEGTTVTAQPNCNGKTLGKMLVPLPPLEEQRRIVKQIEAILPLLNGV